MSESERFAVMRAGRPTWAVAAIHGEAERLRALHRDLAQVYRPGDNLVYLGNVMGRGVNVGETIDELLLFRRRMLARPGADVADIAFLRGGQEEMWQKLLTIQFAPNPREVLEWMAGHGISSSLAAYGARLDDGRSAARESVTALTQWTSKMREAMRSRPGHNPLMSALRRAAYTEDQRLLLTSAGIDTSRPLSEQSDSFWWGATPFDGIVEAYGEFRRIVRGHDPRRGGLKLDGYACTIDGGCGQGGPLVAALFDGDGTLVRTIEA